LTRWLATTFGVLAFVLCASGCSDELTCSDGTYLDGSECKSSLPDQCGPGTRPQAGQCVPDQGGGAVCGPGTHLENGTCTADIALSGNAARFYEVSLTAPAAFVSIANGPLQESFRTGETLMFIATYTPRQGEQRVFGGAGSASGSGYYNLDRATSFDTGTLVAGSGFTTDPFTFQLRAFGAAEPIELVGTVISNGTMIAPDGVTLVETGRLAGVLTPAAAQRVYIETANSSLHQLILDLEIPPDVDFDGNGVKESWTMALTFETIPVWLF